MQFIITSTDILKYHYKVYKCFTFLQIVEFHYNGNKGDGWTVTFLISTKEIHESH